MHRLRPVGSIGRWAIVLGLLLAVAPLAQSPCSRAAVPSSAPDAVTTTVTSGAEWTCSMDASATQIQAVSPERLGASIDLPSGDPSHEQWGSGLHFGPPGASSRAPRLSISSTQNALCPVVLQV